MKEVFENPHNVESPDCGITDNIYWCFVMIHPDVRKRSKALEILFFEEGVKVKIQDNSRSSF